MRLTLWVGDGDPDGGVDRDEPDLSVVKDPQVEPAAVVSATAAVLDAWLWARSPASEVEIVGDPAALEHLHGILGHGIS